MRDPAVALARVSRAEMAKAFITSGEYRGRFHGDPTRGQSFGSIALRLGVNDVSESVARVMRAGSKPGLGPRRGDD